MKTLLYITGWLLSGLLTLLVGSVVVALTAFLVFTPLGWLLLPTALAVLACYRYFNRRHRAEAALNYLEQGMAAGLPPTQLFAALASDNRDRKARLAAQDAAQQLLDGQPMGDVIVDGVPGLSIREKSMMHLGSRTGKVTDMLHRITSQQRRNRDFQVAPMIAAFAYPLAVLTFTGILIGALSVLIFPKFEAIFDDFDIPLPHMTSVLMSFSPRPRSGTSYFQFMVFGFFTFILLTSLAVSAAFRGKLGLILWWLPGGRHLERSRGLADACYVMATELNAGVPAPQAASIAADLAVNPFLRNRLRYWAQAVAKGDDLSLAARAASLPRLFCNMLASGQSAGELPAALHFLRRHYDAQFSRTGLAVRGVLPPLVLLCAASVVGYIVIGLMMPLVALTMSMVPHGVMP